MHSSRGMWHGMSVAVIVALALLSCTNNSKADVYKILADQAVSLLESNGTFYLVELFHFPQSYSSTERATDGANVKLSLDFLVSRFGQPTRIRPSTESVLFYQIMVGGGTGAYWESISPLEVRSFLYRASFDTLGEGLLKVQVIVPSIGAKPEIARLAFGIPEDRPDAKETIRSTYQDLLKYRGIPRPKNFDQLIDQMLTVEEYVPVND